MKIYLVPQAKGDYNNFGYFNTSLKNAISDLSYSAIDGARVFEIEVPDDFFDPAQPTRLESEVKEVKSEQSEA